MARSEHVIYAAEAHVADGRAEGHCRTPEGPGRRSPRALVRWAGAGGGTSPDQLLCDALARITPRESDNVMES